jgi:hypothetical protein
VKNKRRHRKHGFQSLVATLKYNSKNRGNESINDIPCEEILSPQNKQTRGISAQVSPRCSCGSDRIEMGS